MLHMSYTPEVERFKQNVKTETKSTLAGGGGVSGKGEARERHRSSSFGTERGGEGTLRLSKSY